MVGEEVMGDLVGESEGSGVGGVGSKSLQNDAFTSMNLLQTIDLIQSIRVAVRE